MRGFITFLAALSLAGCGPVGCVKSNQTVTGRGGSSSPLSLIPPLTTSSNGTIVPNGAAPTIADIQLFYDPNNPGGGATNPSFLGMGEGYLRLVGTNLQNVDLWFQRVGSQPVHFGGGMVSSGSGNYTDMQSPIPKFGPSEVGPYNIYVISSTGATSNIYSVNEIVERVQIHTYSGDGITAGSSPLVSALVVPDSTSGAYLEVQNNSNANVTLIRFDFLNSTGTFESSNLNLGTTTANALIADYVQVGTYPGNPSTRCMNNQILPSGGSCWTWFKLSAYCDNNSMIHGTTAYSNRSYAFEYNETSSFAGLPHKVEVIALTGSVNCGTTVNATTGTIGNTTTGTIGTTTTTGNTTTTTTGIGNVNASTGVLVVGTTGNTKSNTGTTNTTGTTGTTATTGAIGNVILSTSTQSSFTPLH